MSTIIVLAILLTGVVLALRTLQKKGSCGCGCQCGCDSCPMRGHASHAEKGVESAEMTTDSANKTSSDDVRES